MIWTFGPFFTLAERSFYPKHYLRTMESQKYLATWPLSQKLRPIWRSGKFGLGPNNQIRAFYRVNQEIHEVQIFAIGEKREQF
jgi:hypothetical protein